MTNALAIVQSKAAKLGISPTPVLCTCGEPMSEHFRNANGGRPGRCLKEGCKCSRWSPPKSASKELKRLSNARHRARKKEKQIAPKSNRRTTTTKVLYKAPPKLDLSEITLASIIEKPSNDLRRLVLKLGIASLRAELDRIEKEI